MSPLFGKNRAAKKNKRPGTIAVLDIESGSVGSALVHITPGGKPRLFAQSRSALGMRQGRSASALLKEIEREVEQSLIHLSGVSSRMRAAGKEDSVGRVAVFLHAPWTTLSLDSSRAKAETEDSTLELLRQVARGATHDVPTTFHAFSTTTTPVIHGVFNEPSDALVVSIGSEIAELSLVNDGVIVGYATVPAGIHTLLRTIEVHAGVSREEARSILSLSKHTREHAWAEAVGSAVAHLTRELRSSAGGLLPDYKNARHVFIVSPHESSDFLARALTEDASVHNLFAPGSTVRAVSYKHIAPHLAGHPETPDLPLMLESLFVDTRFGA